MRSPAAVAAEVAATQFGIITRLQAIACGMTPAMIAWRVRANEWQVVHRGVYAIKGASPTWHGRLMAACLAGGLDCAASHTAAAVLWRLEGVRPGVVEVSRTRALRLPGVRSHRVRRLPEDQITRIGVIPVTTPARTLLDLAGYVRRWTLNVALDSARRLKIVELEELDEILLVEATQGRPGVEALRSAVTLRHPGRAPSDSILEDECERMLLEGGLPRPTRYHRIDGADGFVALPDLCYPDMNLILEVQSYAHHSSVEAFHRDADRTDELVALGWRVMYVTARQIRDRPRETVERVRRACLTAAGTASSARAKSR